MVSYSAEKKENREFVLGRFYLIGKCIINEWLSFLCENSGEYDLLTFEDVKFNKKKILNHKLQLA